MQLGWKPHVDVSGPYNPNIVPRHDPFLVEAILQLQSEFAIDCDKTRVVELQSDRYVIAAYDGLEDLVEPHMMVSWYEHPLPDAYVASTQTMTGWGSGIRKQLRN